ncbi:LysE/ArgO family amino acid transporter [Nocardiopsis composta]
MRPRPGWASASRSSSPSARRTPSCSARLRREHVLAVVAICAVSDAALILLGISGIGTVAALAPWLITAVRWGGVAFLVVYGVLALRRAARPGRLGPAEGAAPAGRPRRSPRAWR